MHAPSNVCQRPGQGISVSKGVAQCLSYCNNSIFVCHGSSKCLSRHRSVKCLHTRKILRVTARLLGGSLCTHLQRSRVKPLLTTNKSPNKTSVQGRHIEASFRDNCGAEVWGGGLLSFMSICGKMLCFVPPKCSLIMYPVSPAVIPKWPCACFIGGLLDIPRTIDIPVKLEPQGALIAHLSTKSTSVIS